MGGLSGVLDGLQERFGRQLVVDRDVGSHRQLGVANVLAAMSAATS